MLIIRFFTTLVFFNVFFANYVYWEPAIPSPGGTIDIFYDSEEGTLSDDLSSLFIHLGYNGWQEVDDYEMFYQPQIPDGNWFKFIYNIPSDAETIDFVFTDGNDSWDNIQNSEKAEIKSKLMNFFSTTPINPLIGAAGVSAVPMAARVVKQRT